MSAFKTAVLTGPLPNALANAVSDLINDALKKGMEYDEACCIVAMVAADYARMEYGNGYLPDLAMSVLSRATEPVPHDIADPTP